MPKPMDSAERTFRENGAVLRLARASATCCETSWTAALIRLMFAYRFAPDKLSI